MRGADIVSGNGEACTLKRVVTQSYACRIQFERHHGLRTFDCGHDLHGSWGVSRATGEDAVPSFVRAGRNDTRPDHAVARPTWLAPIDEEGLVRNYPIDLDAYLDDYPKNFTRIGPRRALDSAVFGLALQSHGYVTMKDRTRVAIAGEVVLECMRLYFVTWVGPERAEAAERDMSNFLRDLRLEPVETTEAERLSACRHPNG